MKSNNSCLNNSGVFVVKLGTLAIGVITGLTIAQANSKLTIAQANANNMTFNPITPQMSIVLPHQTSLWSLF